MPFAWVGAILLGAFVPAALFSAVLQAIAALPFALAVTLAHALVLGLPIALIYRAKRWQWPGLAVATGFLIGAIPIGVLAWPAGSASSSSSWANGALLSVDGIPTLAGWLEFLRSLGVYGGLGAVGALTFWLTLRGAGALDDRPSE